MLAVKNLVVQNDKGDLITGATIKVERDVPGTPLASIYSDRAGTQLMDNPFISTSGKVTFFAAGGAYKITITKGAYEDVKRYEPIGRGAETDISNFVPRGEWSDAVEYNMGDVVVHSGSAGNFAFVSLQNENTNHEPDADTPDTDSWWMVYPSVTGPTGATGPQGAAHGLTFNFDSSTSTSTDPGAGKFRLNNASFAGVTEIAIDNTSNDSGNPSVTSWFALLAAGTSTIKGNLYITRKTGTAAFAQYDVTAVVDATGFRRLAVTHRVSMGAPSSGVDYLIMFIPKGDKGDKGDTGNTGATGATGPTGPAGADGTNFDPDARGTFEDRDAYDDEDTGFSYLSVDGDGDSISDPVLFVKLSASSADWSAGLPLQGPKGDPGEPWVTSFGEWSAGEYTEGQAVRHEGSTYRANTTTTEEPPHADWDLIAASGMAALSAIATVAPPGDGVRLIGEVTIAEDDDALQVLGASFVAEDVGKLIVIRGAGAGGATLVSTITAVTGSETISLADNAGTTLNAAETSVAYGTDMLAILQGLIDSLPADGGEIILTGKYLLSDGLNIGDGTSTTVSTRAGVRLRGVGAPQVPRDWVQPADAQDEVIYAGAGGAGSGVININGPLSGWGVKNLGIDGSLLAENGLTPMSAGFGRPDDLVIRNCRMRSLNFDCYSNSWYSGLVSANTDLIVGDNIVIDLPDVAHTLGIMCDGPADGTASTCFVELGNVRIYMKSNQPAYGVYRRVADAVRIKNLLIIANSEVHASAYGVVDDYTKNPNFPSGCVLDTPDVGWNIPEWRQFVTTGSPSEHARPNKICNLTELNGCRYPIGLPNTDLDLPSLIGGKISLAGQNAAIGATPIVTPRRAGLYRVTYYMVVTTAGTSGTLQFIVGYNDPAGAGILGAAIDVNVLNAHDQGSIVVYSDGVNPIQYVVQTGGEFIAGSLQYRLDAVVERLC